jgi:hypothetical protein
LEGDKARITQFHNAMYNYSATNGKLHDMGNGKSFYFYAQPQAVLVALTRIALFSLCNKIDAKGMKGGLLKLAKQKAQSKFDSIKQNASYALLLLMIHTTLAQYQQRSLVTTAVQSVAGESNDSRDTSYSINYTW